MLMHIKQNKMPNVRTNHNVKYFFLYFEIRKLDEYIEISRQYAAGDKILRNTVQLCKRLRLIFSTVGYAKIAFSYEDSNFAA